MLAKPCLQGDTICNIINNPIDVIYNSMSPRIHIKCRYDALKDFNYFISFSRPSVSGS